MASKRPQSAMSAEGTSGHDTPLGSQGSSASASSSVVVVKKEEPSDENENGPPSSKKTAVIPPVSIGKVGTSEEMELRVLVFQNRKLAQQLETQKDKEDELQKRINDMQQLQALNDDTLATVNKFWIQLDENLKLLVGRLKNEERYKEFLIDLNLGFEPLPNSVKWENSNSSHADVTGHGENDEESNSDSLSAASTNKKGHNESFLRHLKTSEKTELEESLSSRVNFTSKIMQNLVYSIETERTLVNEFFTKLKDVLSDEVMWAEENNGDSEAVMTSFKEYVLHVVDGNDRLTAQLNALHQKFDHSSLQMLDTRDKLMRCQEENEELTEKIEDLEHDLSQSRLKADKFERLLVDALQNGGKPLSRVVDPSSAQGGKLGTPLTPGSSKMACGSGEDGEDYLRATLARKEETIESYGQEIANLKKALEEATLDFKNLPEDRITSSCEYKVLQSKFSVIFNENQQLKYQLDEMRNLLQGTKTNHRKHIEQMEKDELSCQKKLRNEVIQLEDTLAQVRKEYEMLRNEFEQNMAQNDQTLPINKEITQITKTLMSNNSHLKTELSRHKRKLKDAQCEIIKLKQQLVGAAESALKSSSSSASESTSSSSTTTTATTDKSSPHDSADDGDHFSPANPIGAAVSTGGSPKSSTGSGSDAESTVVKEMKAQLKKSQENCKEYKMMLEAYKGASKEQRDKVQLMASERKARSEIEELKSQLATSQDQLQSASRAGRDDTAPTPERKLTKSHETLIEEFKKQLASTKQEEEALLKEMEVTGRAFEDLQEQNKRLIDQLKEKDNANFKLMAERIKANQIQRLLQEEKEVLGEQQQVTSQVQVVRRLEDKELHLMNSYHAIEKEAHLRTQMSETLKKKATEGAQTVFEQNLQIEKISSCYEDAKKALAEKVEEQQEVELAIKRKEDEIDRLRRKLERQKRNNVIAQADEVLREEIRMYKSQLTCPCCNVKQIDTVLTKCYHVFCNACIKRRYDTRQRKCPKCSHAFGANDFHRIYI
ncbi:E3 ubiquitin-protein ligase BRE1B-like isoform X2 [Convolutriloba macropyga]|uniref:E3 ubiquitin-protein ligase BRE1B-like isoform X2 n=1 Tax=Convolutriloba macropyga TaxID=536237 RepID=UPI003F51E167